MMTIQEQVELKDYTSWLVGGRADYFCLPQSEGEIIEALNYAQNKNIPWSILSGGSNVLISDEGVEGLVICLRQYTGITIDDSGAALRLDCCAGTGKSDLLKIFLKYKLAPALFLAGLPGDVGGGVVMNAGVAESFMPREFHEIVEWVEILRPTDEGIKKVRLNGQEIHWSYRHSSGWQPGVISRVGICWDLFRDETILERVREANRIRLSKQPLDMPSCGSVFVNPPGHKSAQLIDRCGLKGFQVGGAQVSTKHANFIVNRGTATARDILDVISHVQRTVKASEGVDLQTEVVRMGRW